MMSLFSARFHGSLQTAVAVGVLIQLLCSQSAVAANCDPLMMSSHQDLDRRVVVRGGERSEVVAHLPPESWVVILAAEQGIDVTLQVLHDARQLVGRGDSPLARSGIQRVSFATTAAAEYRIGLTAKEAGGVTGSVHLRVVTVPRAPVADTCLDLQRQLADADAAYASGLMASRQTGAAPQDARRPGPNAARFSKTAAADYAAVARRLSAKQAGSLLLAQVEHAASAVFYAELSDWVGARSWADKAAADYAANHDAYGHAQTQALSAAAQMEIAVSLPATARATDNARASSVALGLARSQFSQLVSFHGRRHEVSDEAQAINNLGLTYYYEGRNDEAIRAYQRALRLFEQLADKVRSSQAQNNIALAEYALGRSARAAQRYSAALRGLSPSQTPQPYAFVLNNLGLAHYELGNYDAALREFSQALELWRAAQNVREQARSLQWIGGIYDAVGDQDQALYYYRAALALRDRNTDPRGRVISLRTAASLIRVRGDPAAALQLHEEAMALAATLSMRARLTVQIAMDLEGLGRRGEAIRRLDSALAEPGLDSVSHAMLLLQRARATPTLGRARASQRDLRAAVRVFKEYELTGLEYDAWLALAAAQRESGAVNAALTSIGQALACAELLRVQSANPELRATLLQPLRPAYDLKISLLADQTARRPGPSSNELILVALSTAELARARALEDFQSIETRAPGVPPQLLVRRDEVLRTLATQRNQLEVRLERAATDDTRVVALRAGIAEGRRQLLQIDAQLGSLALHHKLAGRRTVNDWRRHLRTLPADVAIVEYWLGNEGSFAWVLTHERVTMTALGPAASIKQAAFAFHKGLRNITSQTTLDRLQLSGALYDSIIKPIAPLLVGKRSLVFAPDGALHYISFAALRPAGVNGAKFLIQNHDVSVIPSVVMFTAAEWSIKRASFNKQLLLVTDPVYSVTDRRVTGGAERGRVVQLKLPVASQARYFAASATDLQRLPGTAAEGHAIAALLPAGDVDVLDGLRATREQFLAADLGHYRLIHVATHGLVDTQIPQLSSLIMSTRDGQGRLIEGRVMAADFMAVRLSADVVVLSACDTALGKNVVGEGLIGLRYVILARGAHAVVASLWAVPDQVAARLMASFYRAMLVTHIKVSGALGAAMRELLAEGVADPALWAAFDATLRDSGT